MAGKAAEGEAELVNHGTDALFLYRSMKNRISHCPSCQISHGFSIQAGVFSASVIRSARSLGRKRPHLGFFALNPD